MCVSGVCDCNSEDKLTEAAYNGIQIWTRPLSSWLSSCLVLFWGAWSDRSGLRKPCIIFPLAAQLIISLTNLVSSCVLVRTPLEVPMFSNAIVDGLSGGAGTLLVGVYSYLSDVTAPAELSYRVGLTNVCLLVGNIFGNAVSGLVVRYLGFLAVYGLSASLFVFGLLYTVFCIREQQPEQPADSKEGQTPIKSKWLIRRFFDLDHVVQTFRVVLRTDPTRPRRRPIIILLLVVWVLLAGPMQSEGSLLYLFTRLQFSWTEVEQSFLGTFSSITSLIGSTFIVDVLSGRLAATDATIAIVGLTSKLLANCVYAAAQVSWVFFGGCFVEMLSAGTNIAMRSIASKAVAGDEVGKMNALLALVESAVPLVFLPLYVTVYDATRDYWPSAFLALGVVLMLPAMPVFMCVFLWFDVCILVFWFVIIVSLSVVQLDGTFLQAVGSDGCGESRR